MVTSWISEWHILFWVTLTLTLTSSLSFRNTVSEAYFLYIYIYISLFFLGGGGGWGESESQSCNLNTSCCRRASNYVSMTLAFLYFTKDRTSRFGSWIHFGTVECYILL